MGVAQYCCKYDSTLLWVEHNPIVCGLLLCGKSSHLLVWLDIAISVTQHCCEVNIIVVGLGVVEGDHKCGCGSTLFWV